MARTVVGVAANLCPVDAEGKNIHSSVSCKFAESIRQVGGLPLVIPVGDESVVHDYVEMIDKLILTGGQNVHPQFYGEEKTIDSDDYNLTRDKFELALLKEALSQNKPILAICRGVQLVNVAFGGTLNQDIEGHWQVYLLGLHIPLRQLMAVLCPNCLVKKVRLTQYIVRVLKTWHPIFA